MSSEDIKVLIVMAIVGIITALVWFLPLWFLFWKPWIEDMEKRKKELIERKQKLNTK